MRRRLTVHGLSSRWSKGRTGPNIRNLPHIRFETFHLPFDRLGAPGAHITSRDPWRRRGLKLLPGTPLLHLATLHYPLMAKTIPFSRNTQATRARAAKAMLLPLPRSTADELALQVHLALDALRRGKGSVGDAQTLTQAMLLATFIVEAGYGKLTPEALRTADAFSAACFERGRASGEWVLDPAGYEAFTAIVTVYDQQLQKAPLWAITDASDRLDPFSAGESYQTVTRKRA
jgi:hypothetical protein